MDTVTKRDFVANPVENADGTLRAVNITERVITEKVDAADRVRDRDWTWNEDILELTLDDAAKLVREIMDTMSYYASGQAARDHADYPPRKFSAQELAEHAFDKAVNRLQRAERELAAANDALVAAVEARTAANRQTATERTDK